ncbi:hypothetical protein B0H13DRAFT_1882276 [Mycena leptocephala]|nr:hypothetical protein B0H13DRAFT_1882276 [Mycena leptocephala]
MSRDRDGNMGPQRRSAVAGYWVCTGDCEAVWLQLKGLLARGDLRDYATSVVFDMRVSNLGRALVFGLEPVILAKEDMGAQPGRGSTWLHGSLEPALAATSDDHGSATRDILSTVLGQPPFQFLAQLPFASAFGAASITRRETGSVNRIHYSLSWRKNCDCGDAASDDAHGANAASWTESDEEFGPADEGSAILNDVDEEGAIESAIWNGANEGSAIGNGVSIENGSGSKRSVAKNGSETSLAKDDRARR